MKRIAVFCITFFMFFAMPTIAFGEQRQFHGYERIEEAHLYGGTIVSVFAGEIDSNSVDPYLEAPGDYLRYNIFETARGITSSSNITASTNFVSTTPSTQAGAGKMGRGGVDGVSWDKDTLVLENAEGTVIDIEGPELHVDQLNTYNDKLQTIIDINATGLVYYVQKDFFGGSPHTKTNHLDQDTIRIHLSGTNRFSEIHISGNVRVIFEGDGELILSQSSEWLYDQPGFERASQPSGFAVLSNPVAGFQGNLKGSEELTQKMPNGMERTIQETYEYALPVLEISENLIIDGGDIFNGQKSGGNWYTYVGTESGPSEEISIKATEFN